MFSDIIQFALDHNCDLTFKKNVAYQIKYIDHHYTCKPRIFS